MNIYGRTVYNENQSQTHRSKRISLEVVHSFHIPHYVYERSSKFIISFVDICIR